jgi:hypothetical protein
MGIGGMWMHAGESLRGIQMLNALLADNRAANALVEFLSENRLLPKRLLRRRARSRKRFFESHVNPHGIGAEIGVQKGFFSHVILDSAKPARLHLIDPWYLLGHEWPWATGSKSTTKALTNIITWFSRELSDGSVVLHVGFDTEVLLQFEDGYFDWVYLDTSHTYEDTRRELAVLDGKIKAGGIILGDDWFSDPQHKFHGQMVAIEEFVAQSGYEMLEVHEPSHQWVIRKPLTDPT